MKLIIPILLNALLVLVIYLVEQHPIVKKCPKTVRQVLIGLLFGVVSAFASSYGMEWSGTIVNVRDAAPLTAGLVFGAPAGIISGFVGGIYRWFSVYWGGGTYTRLACSVATILAGFMAAGLRKLMFDDKKPTWGYGVCIAVVCEVIHMSLIFLTNLANSSLAFEFVRGASGPMILGNAVAVGSAILIVSLFSMDRVGGTRGTEQIAQTFQRWLLACVVVAYLVTSLFTFVLQNGIVKVETQEMFTSAINDVQKDVRGKSDDYLLSVVQQIADRYIQEDAPSLDVLAEEYDVVEINIVNKEGEILQSTEKSLVGTFNMNSTEQSRAFMVLTEGEKTFVQEYGPVGSDGITMRKFAGIALEDGHFIQVGYSTEEFRKILDAFVVDVTKNRHVGTTGFIAVCDEELNLVTQTERNGQHISSIGIEPNEDMLQRRSATALCKATIINEENGYAEPFIYVFTFVEGYCIVAAIPAVEAMFLRDASLYTSTFMQVLIFAVLFIFIYVLIKRVIINNLKKVNDTLGQITDGNLDVTVDVRSNQEFVSLSDDINSTVTTLKQYIADAAARIDKELEYAKQIQQSVLPSKFPGNETFDIYAQMIAAKEVGGDFYDVYMLDENTVAFLVADVSGKGIPAAMFMMTAKAIIKSQAESGMDVHDVFTRANEKLLENNESEMFVTAWMGIVDLATGKMQYTNAGHNPPLVKHADGSFEFLNTYPGFVLAGIKGIRYRMSEITLSAGDRFFLYTDGVTEATNANNQLYGKDRLSSFLNKKAMVPAEELLPALKADIDAFVGEAPQFDDITMLMFDYKKERADAYTAWKTFPAKIEATTDMFRFLEETLEGYGCPGKIQRAVSVALEEVFVNVAQYAYGDGEGDVILGVGLDEEKRSISFRMADKGVPFNPLEEPEPDISLSAEEREIGGLGIFITRKTMDEVAYTRENGENILMMKKNY